MCGFWMRWICIFRMNAGFDWIIFNRITGWIIGIENQRFFSNFGVISDIFPKLSLLITFLKPCTLKIHVPIGKNSIISTLIHLFNQSAAPSHIVCYNCSMCTVRKEKTTPWVFWLECTLYPESHDARHTQKVRGGRGAKPKVHLHASTGNPNEI